MLENNNYINKNKETKIITYKLNRLDSRLN